jgi:hypothetical protein
MLKTGSFRLTYHDFKVGWFWFDVSRLYERKKADTKRQTGYEEEEKDFVTPHGLVNQWLSFEVSRFQEGQLFFF